MKRILGQGVASFRDKVVITSKLGWNIDQDTGQRLPGLNSHPDHVKVVVEGMLKRLRTDRIDLLYQHRVDPQVPIDDLAGAFQELMKQGKVLHWGLSEMGLLEGQWLTSVRDASVAGEGLRMGQSEIMIRPARSFDAAALAELVTQLGYPTNAAAAADRLARLDSRPDHAVFVADESSGVAGFIHVCVVETLENDPYAEIKGLIVAEALRGRGIGRELVAAAECWAGERSLTRIRVRSNVKRERARRFYERDGYYVTKASNVFEKAVH